MSFFFLVEIAKGGTSEMLKLGVLVVGNLTRRIG